MLFFLTPLVTSFFLLHPSISTLSSHSLTFLFINEYNTFDTKKKEH